jgi:nucleotide-binding universal stress UspA family protein
MTTRGHEIMVGYDGSAGGAEAVDWAVREARLRDLSLTVCHAWAPGYSAQSHRAADSALPVAAAGGADPAREHAEAVLALGVQHAQACDSAVAPRPLLVCGPAARVLCEQCAGAGMLVVGSRGLGGLAGLLLGSVSLQVAAYAPVPVTVVRGGWRQVPGHPPRPVVVGTDGSPASWAVLDFAAEEAVLRDVPLVAVCALSDTAGVLGAARSMEAEFIAAIGKLRADHPEAPVQQRVEQGAPRSALLAAAAQAQLLVVGARGRGGLREMMLGSVSLAVLHHAPCPVTVVRSGFTRGQSPTSTRS